MMPPIRKPVQLEWTFHARAKMAHYRLGPGRVRSVLHSPKRVEEGIAPKTIAAMQPAALRNGTWTQEIWVMVHDAPGVRRVISAWRYPGVSKPRATAFLRREYGEFLAGGGGK